MSAALSSLGNVGDQVSVRFLQPLNHPNPQWRGTMGIVLVSSSLEMWWEDLGAVSLDECPLDQFVTLDFPLSPSVQAKLRGGYDDLRVVLRPNVPSHPGPWIIDGIDFHLLEPDGGTAGGGGAGGKGGSGGWAVAARAAGSVARTAAGRPVQPVPAEPLVLRASGSGGSQGSCQLPPSQTTGAGTEYDFVIKLTGVFDTSFRSAIG